MTAVGSDAPAPLLTERLLLRPLTADDAGALLRFRAHPAATRYLSHGPLTPEQNSARLQQALSAAESSTAEWFHFGWAFELRATGEVVGDGRTWNTEEPRRPAGYPPNPRAWATSCTRNTTASALAARRPAPWSSGFSTARGSETIFAGVYEPNLPSRRLLEGLGFRMDRFFPVSEDTAGKQLPSWRYRLDRASPPLRRRLPLAAVAPGHRTCPAHAPGTGHNALMPTPGRQE